MIKVRSFLGLLVATLAFAPSFLGAEETKWLSYDPAVVTLTGTLVKETYKGEDAPPALKGSTSWILRLEKPVSVKANTANELDEEEKDVKEVQLALGDSKIEALVLAKFVTEKTKLSVTGKLYHAHTAYHVRPVLTLVSSVKAAGKDGKTD